MINIPDNLPVPYDKTMPVVDSSKTQAFMDCPRGFFFSYVLGLRPVHANVHLDFGSAWHDAMEHLLLYGYDEENVNEAYVKFLATYREAFPDPITDPDKAPKNPEYAYKALKLYTQQYATDNYETLYTETAGLVPISESREFVVKLDSILRDRNTGQVFSMEHKTTGRNSASWREKWSYILQVEAYTHLLYALFPPEDVKGVVINGSVFTKSKTWEGVRIPVHKSKDQMAAFLWTVNHWIDQIEWNYQKLAETKPDDPVMTAFPINCMSCGKFGCRTGGLCAAFPNPLRFAEEPPTGYVKDFWDPLRGNLEKADNVIEQDEKGELHVKPKSEELDKELKESKPPALEPEKDDFSYLLPDD